MAHRLHQGPLVVQKMLYPEAGVCHGVVLHPPGGIAGGDDLHLQVNLQAQTQVLLTTPGATKWYKANGKLASQRVDIEVESDACLEWFPQENILFNGACISNHTHVRLHEQACYAAWEVTCLGRQAQQESWAQGSCRQRLEISLEDGQLIWQDSARFDAHDPILKAVCGLNGRVVYGSMVIARKGLAQLSYSQQILAECRAIAAPSDAHVGISLLDNVFVARYVGDASAQAKAYFEQIWQVLRPWYLGKQAHRPRIWNT